MRNFTKSIIVCLCMLLPLGLMAQELQVATNEKGKVGYKNKAGAIVIPCTYESAEPFNIYGYAKVGNGKKYGLIKTDGSLALPLEYSEIIVKGNDELIRIQKTKGYGLFNAKEGKTVLEPTYTFISQFNCYGLAWIELGGKIITSNNKQGAINGKMGIINREGKILVPPTYKGLFEFDQHTTLDKQAVFGEADLATCFGQWLTDTLKTDCQYLSFTNDATSTRNAGIMDLNGNELLPMNVYTWVAKPVGGFCRYWIQNASNIPFGYYNINTKQGHQIAVINSSLKTYKYTTHEDFYGNIAPVNSNDGWYFIDKNYTTLKSGFNNFAIQRGINGGEGYMVGRKTGGTAIFKEDGTEVLTNIVCDNANVPNGEYGTDKKFALKINGKWGLFTIEGNQVIAPQYEYMTSSVYGIFFVEKDGKWGAVDKNNKQLVPIQYSTIRYPKASDLTNLFCANKDTVYTNYNTKTGEAKGHYVYVDAFEDGIAAVNPLKEGTTKTPLYTGKRIMINQNGDAVFEMPFPWNKKDEVREYILKYRDSKTGILSKSRQKQLIMKFNRGKNRYQITGTIPESDWDF